MANQIVVEIDLDDDGAVKAITGLEQKAKTSGKKAGDNLEKNFGKSLTNLGKSVVKFGALIGGVFSGVVIAKAIQAAQVQEDAVKRLNVALQQSGDFSQQATQDLQDYAASLQQVTEFGDEVIINQLALAKSFGATNEQAKQIAETATGLAKSFGIDLESATRNVSKTIGGYSGELGELIPELRELTKEQLQAGEGIRLLSERFGNAGKNLNTFSFASAQLSNTFGDLLEAVGEGITKNPALIAGIQQLSKIFGSAIKPIRDFAQSFNVFTDVLMPLTKFNNAIITFVISPLELLTNVFNLVQSGLNVFVAGIVAGFGKIAGAAGKLLSFFSPDSETAVALQTFAESSKEVFNQVGDDAVAAYDKIFEFPIAERLAQQNAEFASGLAEQNEVIKKASVENEAVAKKSLQKIQKDTFQIGGAIVGSLQKLTVDALSRVGAALVKGKDAWANFSGAVLGIIGDLAIQLGTIIIFQGKAIEALKSALLSLNGGVAIAAGLALIAAGGALKALAGGDSGSGGATASAGGGGFSTTTAIEEGEETDVAGTDPQEQQTNQLIVQGDIFQTEETQRSLVELLSDGFEKNGTALIGGSFA